MTENIPSKWPRRLRITFIVIVAIIAVLQTILAVVATSSARGAIGSALVPASNLQRLYVNLFGGSISVKGLSIDQPEGFGEGKFVSLGKAKINISLSSLLIGKIKVSDIRIADLAIAIITDTNGVMNIARLTPPSDETSQEISGEKGEVQPSEDVPAEMPEVTEQPALKEEPSSLAIKVGKIRVDRLSLTYLDQSKSETKPTAINLRDVNIKVDDLLFAPAQANRKELITDIELTGRFEHADTPPAFIGLVARLGPVGVGAPGTVANLVISGLELSSAGSVIPPGVAATLAGDVLDLNATVRMAPDILDVRAELETTGAKFPVTVGGTPDDPKLGAGAILFGAFGRVGNLVGNTASDLTSAGMAVGEGAVNVASSVGKGAANLVGGVGKGLFNVAKSAATGDIKGMGTNLADTVTSAGKSAVSTVTDAGSTAISTVGEAGKATAGSGRADEWRATKQTRYEKNWEAAQTWLKEQSYPVPDASTIDAGANVEEEIVEEASQPSAE